MLYSYTNFYRGLSVLPRLLSNAKMARFKIWEVNEKQKLIESNNNTIHSLSIETNTIYASLNQNRVDLFFKKSSHALCSYILNEQKLNGDPNHEIYIKDLNNEFIESKLEYFVREGNNYGSTRYQMLNICAGGIIIETEKNMAELTHALLDAAGIEKILEKPMPEFKNDSIIIPTLLEAEKIQAAHKLSLLGRNAS